MRAGFNFPKHASYSWSIRAVKVSLVYAKVLMAVDTKILSYSSHSSKKGSIEYFKNG